MGYIQGFRIKNYRLFKDIALGSILTPAASSDEDTRLPEQGKPLTPITVVIGRNGYGKSTLCDALGFIVDCLKSDAEQACMSRGGFDKIASDNSDKIVEFQIRYESLLYTLCIAADEYNIPFVFAETLSHIDHIGGTSSVNFFVKDGEGKALHPRLGKIEDIRLADKRRLVLSTLGNLTDYPDIVAFREFLDSWYLCYFTPDAARVPPLIGSQKHLSRNGHNLANVIQYWEREHQGRLDEALNWVLGKVLGIRKIETRRTEDGRLLLRFFEDRDLPDQGEQKPFYASQMSDGTLKLVAYLLLLGDPQPPPLVCFEEPENGLYHRLLGAFVEEIRRHAKKSGGAQFFITTHQPYLVDALNPHEVWILDKGSNAFATVRRASDDPVVRNMVVEGMSLGALWFSEYLDNA